MHHILIPRPRFQLLILACAVSVMQTAANARSENGDQSTMPLKPAPKFSGYFQPCFSLDRHGTGTFFLKRARCTASASLSRSVSWKMQAELAGQPKVLDVLLRITLAPAVRFSAGQFKIPVSRENLLSSGALISFSRSRVVEALTARSSDPLGNQNGRDTGIKLEGDITLNQRKAVEYAIAFINGSGINHSDNNRRKDLAVRVAAMPLSSLTLAVSSYIGRYRFSPGEGSVMNRNRIGGDITWAPGSCLFIAEYLRGRDGETEKYGWYLQALFPLAGDNLFGVLKFDRFTADCAHPENSSTIFILGLNYEIDTHTRLMIEYSLPDDAFRKSTCGTTIIMMQTGI